MICEGLKKDHADHGDDSVSNNRFHSCTPLNLHACDMRQCVLFGGRVCDMRQCVLFGGRVLFLEIR